MLRELNPLIAFYCGCLSCYLLQTQFAWSAVAASAFLGVVITLIPAPRSLDRKGFEIAFFAGIFAGMSSPQLIASPLQVLMISVLGALIFILARPHLSGVGGKMGAVAFISTALWILVRAST